MLEDTSTQPNLIQRLWGLFADARLRTKLTITFVFVSVSSLSILAVVNIYFTQLILTDEANRALNIAAVRTIDRINGFINTNFEGVASDAQIPVFQDYLITPESRHNLSHIHTTTLRTLRFLQSRQPWLLSYAILNKEGNVVIDTTSLNVGLNQANHDYFRVPMENNQPYMSPIQSGPNGQIFYFSAPISGRFQDQLNGVLRVEYDANILQTLIEEADNLIGAESFAILANKNLTYLAEGLQEQKPDRRFQTITSQHPILAKSLQTASDEPFVYQDEVTGQVFQVIRKDLGNTALANDWVVAFFQPRDSFLASAQTQQNFTLALVVGSMILLVIIVIAMARLLTLPIVHLTQVAQAIHAGDLGAKANIKSKDEIGVLATSIDDMTTQLRDSISDLDQQAKRLNIIIDISQGLTRQLDIDEIAASVVNQVKESFDYYHVHIYLFNQEIQSLVMHAGVGEVGAKMQAENHTISFNDPTSLVARAARTREIVTVNNVREDPSWLPNPLLPDTYSEMTIPIMFDVEVIGVLGVQQNKIGGLTETDALTLRSLANQVAVAVRNANLFTQLETTLSEAQETQQGYIELAGKTGGIEARQQDYLNVDPEATILPKPVLSGAKTLSTNADSVSNTNSHSQGQSNA